VTTRPPLRVGIVGTGGIATRHVDGYRFAGAELAALCDINPEALARRQREWGVADGYLDYAELLADESIDAVSVCTPNAAHAAVTIAAAAAGKHVLCEKPIALELDEADAMIDACTAAGVVLQIGHHMRSWSAARRAHDLISAGAIGEVTYARFRQAHDWGGAPSVRSTFGSIEHAGGGTLLDNGCHLFDLARHLVGGVSDVYTRPTRRKFDIEVEDTAITSLGFSSGAIGQIEVAWTATGWQEAFWIFGTEGSLECDNRSGAPGLVHRFRGVGNRAWDPTDAEHYAPRGLDAHSAHIRRFVQSVVDDEPVVCTGADGREAVRLVLAAYQSAARNSVVAPGA
jgi:predicted dehydrogenase